MPVKKRDSDTSADENEEVNKASETVERQNLFVVFTHERELRNVDQVRIKISQFTGVCMRCKNITAQAMENLLTAIEQDAANFKALQQNIQTMPTRLKPQTGQDKLGGLEQTAPQPVQTPNSGIINLRFEECVFATKAVQLLKAFLSQKQLIETFVVQKVEFQDPVQDFRSMIEGLQFSLKIRKVGLLGLLFDEEPYGKIICHLLNDCRQLREFDVSQCEFFHPKCFFDMCQAFIGEKCRVNLLKLCHLHISTLEGKVLQFVLMKNKSLHTLDISNSKVDSAECLEFFFQKFDKYSNIRYLILDNIMPDLSNSLEILGEALTENTKLEVMIMRDNKLKWIPYSTFWENIKGNTSLQKISVSKTDLSDRVLEKMVNYLMSPDLRLVDLDLSRNQLTDVGLQNLSECLKSNTTIKFLNLSQNMIRDVGLRSLVKFLSSENCVLQELSLMGNKINNEGIHILSEFIKPNKSLKMLDISKNAYSDISFQSFAAEMGPHATLTFLDISKSKELNDEGSLITLARQLAFNTHLQTLELTAVRVRKPFLKLYMEPALKKNITLKYVVGKLTPDIIDEQLNINIQIQTEVEPNFQASVRPQKQLFDVRLLDPQNASYLCMRDQPSFLFDATFKFLVQREVRQIDLSNMSLQDGQLYQLASYLQQIPPLRSIILNNNQNITDDGIMRIASALSSNNKLAHLAFVNCKGVGNESLQALAKVISEDNMMVCQIDFDESQFNPEIAKVIKRETLLNRAIQENLKPIFYSKQQRPDSAETHDGSPQQNLQYDKDKKTDEVVFQPEAQVHKYIHSAIKCWRIARPNIIQIENQQLTDRHVKELCLFLRDRNMIHNLNLRRNRITNAGAQLLIDWMLLHDVSLTHLDVSRNRITRAGAQSFLSALKKLTRIQDFQIEYGNPIPLDVSLGISQEIQANNQIMSNQSEMRGQNHNSKVTLSSFKYELIDRGPNYMRCAIKSVELLKITYLSLPDNMLGLEESKMLAAMIAANPPLRILNLETNNLDASCAKLLGEAIESNTNLQWLNISKNKLSDMGINYLLQSLIKSKMQLNRREKTTQKQLKPPASEEQTNLHTDKDNQKNDEASKVQDSLQISILRPQASLKKGIDAIGNSSDLINQRSKSLKGTRSPIASPQTETVVEEAATVLPTEEIERCEQGQLKILNLVDNHATEESYKSIQTLLKINKSIVIYFDSPTKLQNNVHNDTLLTGNRPAIDPQSPKVANHDDSQLKLLGENGAPLELESQVDLENAEVVVQGEESNEIIVKKRKQYCETLVKRWEKVFAIVMKVSAVICCFKMEKLATLNRQKQTLSLTLFWRVHYWKQNVLEFDPNPERIQFFDKPVIQNTILFMFALHRLIQYVFLILPFFVQESVVILMAFFLGYLLIFESLVVVCSRVVTKLSVLNPYLWLQIFSGFLKKSTILSLAFIGGQCSRKGELAGNILGWLYLCIICLDQYKALAQIWDARTVDKSAMMPLVERTQKITELLSYQGFLIVLKRITLVPSKMSRNTMQQIQHDLNPDLIQAPVSGFLAKCQEFIKKIYHNNSTLRHLIFIDFPLICAIVIALATGWLVINNSVSVILGLFVLDSLACYTEVRETDSELFKNSDAVYLEATKRNQALQERYQEVLMREKEIIIMKIEEQHNKSNSESSMFEANENDLLQGEAAIEPFDEKRLTQGDLLANNNEAALTIAAESRVEMNQTGVMEDGAPTINAE